MMQAMRPMRSLLAVASVCALAACGSLRPVDASGLKRVAGGELPGAKGLSIADQDRIDDTVARGCATGIYPATACARHTIASRNRRAELAQNPAGHPAKPTT